MEGKDYMEEVRLGSREVVTVLVQHFEWRFSPREVKEELKSNGGDVLVTLDRLQRRAKDSPDFKPISILRSRL